MVTGTQPYAGTGDNMRMNETIGSDTPDVYGLHGRHPVPIAGSLVAPPGTLAERPNSDCLS